MSFSSKAGTLRVAAAFLSLEDDPVTLAVRALAAPLASDWETKAREALAELEARIDQLQDETFSRTPDALRREGGREEEGALQELALALVAALEARTETPLALARSETALAAAERLARRGALLGGMELDLAAIGAERLSLAADDLGAVLAGRTVTRRGELLEAAQVILRSRTVRRVPIQRQAWREAVLAILGADGTPWVRQAVEIWGIRWQSIGALVAASQAGVQRLVAVNPVDDDTSTFCRWVHGRSVSVAEALGQADSFLEAVRDRDVVRAIDAWPLLPASARGVSEFEEHFARTKVPPFHWGCRTQLQRV